ncbi:MAG: DUF1351 domain-containing protein [Bacteroidales bacterium]|jgi:hypothetical protein|nr:DUF1351 domain-containing protein [Bacteroidales bacterium]
METRLAKVELQEKDLELVVSEKTLGRLVTNAQQIKELVTRALPYYDIANYDESNIDLAKKDKAMLNKAAKALTAKRIEFEREFMKPFGEFKDVIGDTVKLISECSDKIDTVVKQSDERAREEKRAVIKGYFDGKGFTLVGLSKIFDERWLNKTVRTKDVFADIDARIDKINYDIKTIEAIGEDVDLLKSIYLNTLDINSTLQYANTLKQNRERAQREAEERARREAEEKARMEAEERARREAEIQAAQKAETKPCTGTVPVQQIPEPTPPIQQEQNQEQEKPAEIYIRAFKVRTTRDNIIALGDFMNAKGIEFQRIEL